MSRAVTSPVIRWPGTVVLADPLSFPQFAEWQRAITAAQAVVEANGLMSEYDAAILPGLLACVESWALEGIGNPPAPFPATPRQSSRKLISWLLGEVASIANEADEPDPK